MKRGDIYPPKPRAWRVAIKYKNIGTSVDDDTHLVRWILCTVSTIQKTKSLLRVKIIKDPLDKKHGQYRYWPGTAWLNKERIVDIKPLKTKKDYFLFTHRLKMDNLVSLKQ